MANKKVTTTVKTSTLKGPYDGGKNTTATIDLQIKDISAAFTNTQMTVKKKKYSVRNYDIIKATQGAVTIDTSGMSNAIGITTGAKNDTIVVGSGKTTVTAANGNDTIKIGKLAAGSIIDGGGGTDTLVFKNNVTATINGTKLTVDKKSSTCKSIESFTGLS